MSYALLEEQIRQLPEECLKKFQIIWILSVNVRLYM